MITSLKKKMRGFIRRKLWQKQSGVLRLCSRQAGFTMIELVITMGVFTFGIMAAFTLSLANYNVAQENYNRILAANLAREGIEIVKNIRDSNWLKIEGNYDCDPGSPSDVDICTWNYGLIKSVTSTAEYNYKEGEPLGIIPDDTSINDCYDNGTCRLYKDANNFYDHDYANGSGTNLARVVVLHAICFSETSPPDDRERVVADVKCLDPRKLIGFQVTSIVRWYRGDKSEDVKVVENIYNWRDYGD